MKIDSITLPQGVFQKKGRTSYYSMVQRSCKTPIYLGSFDTVEEAERAYNLMNNKIISGELDYNVIVTQREAVKNRKKRNKAIAQLK